jgi:hypothetical protein
MTLLKPKIFDNKWYLASIGASLFWYFSLFPGRISSDGVEAVNIIENGQSTDWWTALYFWFLRISTFWGNQLWLASLLSLGITFFSIKYFVNSLPEKKQLIEKVTFFVCASPLFGNFAVTVNHDIFFSSGVFLLLGITLRKVLDNHYKSDQYISFLAIFFLMNSKIGYVLIFTYLFFLVAYFRNLRRFFLLLPFVVLVYFISTIGVTKSVVPKHYLPFIADLKCVAQHPEARIRQDEWLFLESIAPIERWKEPLTCSNMDIANSRLRSPEQDKSNLRLDKLSQVSELNKIKLLEFFTNYISISLKNPAIVIQAHLQRSSVALPPPFFQGPQNQVDQEISNPVGLNSNIALQQGPTVLHPSIDDPKFKIKNSFLKIFESSALFTSFLINQASWFWGWGGLWLWPLFIYLLFVLKIRKLLDIILLTFPILTTHLVLILVGPAPLPRYVMSTILVGFVTLIFLITKVFNANAKH